jgi:hypothetical protein
MSNTLNIGLIDPDLWGRPMLMPTGGREFHRNLPRTPVLYAVADQNDALAEQSRSRLGFERLMAIGAD